MTADFNVILNFNSAKPVITGAEFKAGDKGFTINMDVRELDPTGMTPKIAFYRSNGTSVESSAVTNVGNIFSYTLLGNELAVPGVVVADLKFYDGDDQRISSASFIFTAISDTLDGLGGGTGGYSDQLEQLSEEFEDTLNEYKDAFGDVGAVNPRGAYDSTADYNVLDLVSYNGSSYLCRTACKNKVPTNTTYWQVFASGSGAAGDYDDLTDKPSINSVTLSGNKTTEDLGLFSGDYNDLENKPTIPADFDDLSDVDMAGVTNGQVPTWDATAQKYKPGTPAAGGGTNPNLLINPWFTVNQRGFTSGYYTSWTYIVDRWKAYTNNSSGSVAIGSSGLTITPASGDNALIEQIYENITSLNGRTLTASVMLSDGTIISGTVNAFDSTANTVFFDTSNIHFEYDKNSTSFRVSVTATKTIRAVKLEIGSTSTLALDSPPDYSIEILKCQRYYIRMTSATQNAAFCIGFNGDVDKTIVMITLHVPMRVKPTFTYGGALYDVQGSDATIFNVSSVGIADSGTNDILQLMFFTAGGMTVGAPGRIVANGIGSYLEFNAEL